MYKNRNSEIDLDLLAGMLKDAVAKVKSEENPDILNQIKKIYKKNVPFTMRMYVASYLAKEAQNRRHGFKTQNRDFRQTRDYRDGGMGFSSDRRDMRTRDFSSSSFEERAPRPRIEIDPAVSATIFISIGRNRHVFTRDLVGLLIGVAGLDRDRIGNIRVLANYSFVQLFAEDAQKAINAINGYDYRGRKLAASFSRHKEGGFDAPADSDSAVSVQAEQSAEDSAAYAAAEKAASDREPFSSSVTPQEAGAEAAASEAKEGAYLV
ncbi:MAG: DbpA RNA binding domain-containing protein [Treponema sp.]